MRRERIGNRQHRATFSQHDGTQGADGNPTFTTSADWDAFVTDWPCEMVAVRGGESLRGRQVAATTTHVLFGEYQGANGILPPMRCVINGNTRQVVSVMDVTGEQREMRIELKKED